MSSNFLSLSELSGGSAAAKFENIGDKHVGRIVSFDERQQTDPKDQSPRFFPSGAPMMVKIINIEEEDGEVRALFARAGNFEVAQGSGESMLNAIGTAVRKAGADRCSVGGRLAVQHTGMGKPRPGLNAPRLYTAQYIPPTPQTESVPVDDLFTK